MLALLFLQNMIRSGPALSRYLLLTVEGVVDLEI